MGLKPSTFPGQQPRHVPGQLAVNVTVGTATPWPTEQVTFVRLAERMVAKQPRRNMIVQPGLGPPTSSPYITEKRKPGKWHILEHYEGHSDQAHTICGRKVSGMVQESQPGTILQRGDGSWASVLPNVCKQCLP